MDLPIPLTPVISLALTEVALDPGVMVDDLEVLDLDRLEHAVHLRLSSFIICQHLILVLGRSMTHVVLLVGVNQHFRLFVSAHAWSLLGRLVQAPCQAAVLAALEHGAHMGHRLLDAGHVLVRNSYILQQFLDALLQREDFRLVPLLQLQGLLLELVKCIFVELFADLELVRMRVKVLQFLLHTFLLLLQCFHLE